jgi:hypothetical protein
MARWAQIAGSKASRFGNRARGVLRSFTVWRESHSHRRLLKALGSCALLCAGTLTCLILAPVGDWQRAWAAGMDLGAPLALLLVLPAVSHFVKMLGWRSLLPAAARPNLPRAYAVFLGAQAVNEIGISVLGEPIKILALSRQERAAGLRAVVADNVIALAALCAVLSTLAFCSGAFTIALVALAGLLAVGGGARKLVSPSRPAVAFAFAAH